MTNEQHELFVRTIALCLGANWHFNTLNKTSLISERKSLSFSHHKGRFTITGIVSPLKSLQHKFNLRCKTAAEITVTDRKTISQIAEDIKRRVFPYFEEAVTKVVNEENYYINKEEKLTLYANILQPLINRPVSKVGRNYVGFGDTRMTFEIYQSGYVQVLDMSLDFDTFYEIVALIKRKNS